MNGIDRPGRAEHSEHGDRPLSDAERIAEYEARLQANPAKLDPFERLSREELRRLYGTGEADQPKSSGWEAPDIAAHPNRPDPERIHLTEERRTHILDGDRTGGGHRFGTGRPEKTEFPERWDDDTAVGHIVDVARVPETVVYQDWNERWKVRGSRDDVEITVIVNPSADTWTAWPEPGGSGVVDNPKERPDG